MSYRIGLILLLVSSFAFWQGCGQTAINDSEVNSAVTTADEETTNNNTTDNDTTDTTSPTISSTYPSDSASSVAPNTSLTVTFSEAMDTTTITTNSSGTSCLGSLQLSSDAFSTCVQMFSSPTASDSNKTFTLDPASNLSYNTTYKLKITIDAKDSAGNALASVYRHSSGFSTSSSPDTTAPTVTSSNPADSDTSVAENSSIAITFSEAMDTTTVSTNTSNTTCSGSLQVSSDSFNTCVQMSSSPTISNSNKTYTVTPSSSMSFITTYKIRVTTGVKDMSGNALSSQWTTSNGFTSIGAIDIKTGGNATCANVDNSSLYCWGDMGVLGLSGGSTPSKNSNYEFINYDIGSNSFCYVKQNGSVYCSGALNPLNNSAATSINNQLINGISSPKSITGFSMGVCFVTQSGSIKCLGTNNDGQLGNGTTNYSLSLVDVNNITTAISVHGGTSMLYAILANNTVMGWGVNSGSLCGTDARNLQPVICNNYNNSNKISSWGTRGCAVLNSGVVNCNGSNIAGINTAIMISVSSDASCALLSSGQIKCWGSNIRGELGDGTSSDSSSPVSVVGINTAKKITSGGSHFCALLTDGKIKCWGYQKWGRLGNGSNSDSAMSTPQFVVGFGG